MTSNKKERLIERKWINKEGKETKKKERKKSKGKEENKKVKNFYDHERKKEITNMKNVYIDETDE